MSLKNIAKKANYNAPYYVVGDMDYHDFVTAAVKGDKNYIRKKISKEPIESLTFAFIKSMDIGVCEMLLKTGLNIDSGIATEACINTAEERTLPELHYYICDLRTALWVACEKDCFPKVAWLLKNGANPKFGIFGTELDNAVKTPAIAALYNDSAKCMELLLKTGKYDKDLNSLLDLAAQEGKFKIVQLLVNKFKAKWTNLTIQKAIPSKNYNIIKFFMSLGAKIDEKMLLKTLTESDAQTIKFILQHTEYDANTIIRGKPLLFYAAEIGIMNTPIIVMLLNMGADITKKNNKGQDIFEFIKNLKQFTTESKKELIKTIKTTVAKKLTKKK